MNIYKDGHKIDVSPDAYRMMYKRLGYKVLEEDLKSNKKQLNNEDNNKTLHETHEDNLKNNKSK